MNLFNLKTQKAQLWIFISLICIFIIGEYSRLGDFLIYLEASVDFFKNEEIYVRRYGAPAVFPYMGSPTLAFLLYPFTLLPFLVAASIWKIINIFLILRVWWLLRQYLPFHRYSNSDNFKLTLYSFLSISFLLYFNFHLVQFTIFLLFSVLESIYRIRNKKQISFGALILSLGIITKLLPVVAIPYFIFRGYFKAAFLSLTFTFLLFFVPSLYVGLEYNTAQNLAWANSINPSQSLNVFDVSTRNIHGVASLISTLTIDGIGNSYSLKVKRNIVDLDPQIVIILILVVKLFLICFSLFFLNLKSIFRDNDSRIKQLWELSYILGVIPLIFPQQRSYAFLFLFPAIASLVHHCFFYAKKINYKYALLLILILTLTNLELLLGHFRQYYWHFKTLTYASLFLLLLLSLKRPAVSKNTVVEGLL
jgi:hypothetical protein